MSHTKMLYRQILSSSLYLQIGHQIIEINRLKNQVNIKIFDLVEFIIEPAVFTVYLYSVFEYMLQLNIMK